LKTGDLAVYLVTVVGVVFLNLLHGVMIGLVLAIILTGWRVVRAKIEATVTNDEWQVVIEGACTFLSLPRLTRVLASVPERTTVTVHLLVSYLDHAAHQAITDWQRQHHATGGAVEIQGVVEVGRLTRRVKDDLVEPESSPANAGRRNGRLAVVPAIPETSERHR
jgi:MFS superfamily sulfate permease-like transporter